MIAEANERAREAGVEGWVEHKVCDVSAMPFEEDYLDACHAERLFMHLQHEVEDTEAQLALFEEEVD